MTTRFITKRQSLKVKPSNPKRMRRLWPYYLMMLPAILLIAVYRYIPMGGLAMVFKDYRITRSLFNCDWVGLKNFQMVFSKYTFSLAFYNTIIISFYKLIFVFPTPILLALMLNELHGVRMKRVLQTCYYLPHFISWVVISSLVFTFFAPESGAITVWFRNVLGININVLTDAKVFRGTLVVTDIWKEIGWGSIIYLATITSIDPQLYEAARVDGAKKLQQIWYVTLPGILPTIITMLLLRVGHILDAGFEQVLVMQNTLVWDVSEILETYSYSLAFLNGKHAQAAVVGCVKSVIGLIMVLITNRIAKHYDQEVL